MTSTLRPLSKRQLAELRGYVAPGVTVFRALLFLIAVALVGALVRALQMAIVGPRYPLVWIAATAAFAVFLFRTSGRWTGGSDFRAKVRRDLRSSMPAATRIDAVDAIAVEEQEDEGPTFFLLTADGRTMVFRGQYLTRPAAKGFPWRSFEILEAEHSRHFFGFTALGPPLTPSTTLQHQPSIDPVAAGDNASYAVIDVPFETLRAPRSEPRN